MLIEQAIFQLLSTDALVTSYVDTRIYPLHFPKITTDTAATMYPAIVYKAVGGRSPESLGGSLGITRRRFRFFASSVKVPDVRPYFLSKQISIAIDLVLQNFRGTVQLAESSPPDTVFIQFGGIVEHKDEYDEKTNTFTVITDYEVVGSEQVRT